MPDRHHLSRLVYCFSRSSLISLSSNILNEATAKRLSDVGSRRVSAPADQGFFCAWRNFHRSHRFRRATRVDPTLPICVPSNPGGPPAAAVNGAAGQRSSGARWGSYETASVILPG